MTVPARAAWPTPWPEVDRAVERLLDGVGDAVGGQLVGLYLHGSLALGDFFPPASDLDFHAATAGPLDDPALARLGALHAAFKREGGWVARFEGVYLPLAALRRQDPAGGRLPTVGTDWDFGLGPPGPTWVLDRWVTREHGAIVTGPDPRELIDPIGPGDPVPEPLHGPVDLGPGGRPGRTGGNGHRPAERPPSGDRGSEGNQFGRGGNL